MLISKDAARLLASQVAAYVGVINDEGRFNEAIELYKPLARIFNTVEDQKFLSVALGFALADVWYISEGQVKPEVVQRFIDRFVGRRF